MRRLTILLTALTLVFAAMPTAMAGDTSFLRGEFEGGGMPVFDPEAVTERCPEGYQWILQTFGSGAMRSATGETDFTFSGSHCSRYIREPDSTDRWFPGRAAEGVMAMATPQGELVVSYSGFWIFKGDTTVPDFVATAWLPYRIEGDESTGVFEGASGRGLLLVTDNSGYETGRLFGRITLDH